MQVAFTMVMIGVLFVVLAVFDVVVYAMFGSGPTISRAMYRIGLEWPIVVACWGGLGAHFFMVHNKLACNCSVWEEVKPAVLMVLGYVLFRLSWVQVVN